MDGMLGEVHKLCHYKPSNSTSQVEIWESKINQPNMYLYRLTDRMGQDKDRTRWEGKGRVGKSHRAGLLRSSTVHTRVGIPYKYFTTLGYENTGNIDHLSISILRYDF